MARKNIFQLVDENYDTHSEIRKINELFEKRDFFEDKGDSYTFKELVETFLFNDWKYRDTCISVGEFFKRGKAEIPGSFGTDESAIVNNIEIMDNFIKLYFDKSYDLFGQYGVRYYSNFNPFFCELVYTLEKRMGLSRREYKDKVILYPKNAPLEKVVDLVCDEDVQWELIRYVREELSLAEKRKILAFLATNLSIEEDSQEKNEQIKTIIGRTTNVLNNLHIRHNNKTGKWENKVLEDINEKEAIDLCDMVYNEMLTIVLLREHKRYEETYSNFNKKQKDAAKAKKSEGR